MIQTSGSGKTVPETSPSCNAQQGGTWFARHTQDVSDASLAEFERLMAFMGYRHLEPTARTASGTPVTGGRD